MYCMIEKRGGKFKQVAFLARFPYFGATPNQPSPLRSLGEDMNAASPAAVRPWHLTHDSVLTRTAWIILFAVLTALGAQIEVARYPVPYTLQTLFVLLAGAFLGARNGALSQVLYLSAGALGAPVFSSFGFGVERLFGPTGGYLLAFPAAAAVVGWLIERRRTLPWRLLAMGAGLLVVFTSGTIQLYAVLLHDWSKAFAGGFLIFSWWDLLKVCAAAMTYHEIARRRT